VAVARRATLAVGLGGLLIGATARARVPCASDGPPLYADDEGYAAARAIEPSASVTLWGAPWASGALRRAGDPVDGAGFDLAGARFGVCGASDGAAYRIVYEPWDAAERARVDARSWGRMVDAALAWLPASWAAVAAGVSKVPFSRGREQPIGALPLAVLPYSTAAIAPDRRLGLTGDADFGVARLAAGLFMGSRSVDLDAPAGILAAARITLEPVGPVGRRTWPRYEARPPAPATGPSWNERMRGAAGLSIAYRRDGEATGWAAGADFALHAGRLALDGEVLYADHWPLERPTPTPGALGRRIGGFVEALVLVWSPWLAVAARAEYLDEDLSTARSGRFVAVAAGANLYALGPSIQLQALYSRRFPLAGGPGADALLFALTVGR
jgi:hypothetical protein